MKKFHRSQFLFLNPQIPPTELPIEDELTAKVDFISTQCLPIDGDCRGVYCTYWGVYSDGKIYRHPFYPLETNSLAPYYIRHHRQDICQEQLAWIDELYNILRVDKAVYYDRLYHLAFFKMVYVLVYQVGDGPETFAVAIEGTPLGVKESFSGAFYDILTKNEYDAIIKTGMQRDCGLPNGVHYLTLHELPQYEAVMPQQDLSGVYGFGL